MTDDIVYLLRTLFQSAEERNEPVAPVEMLEAADEIVRLRAELAVVYRILHDATAGIDAERAERAEADADRLAAEVMRLMCACTWRTPGAIGYRCTKCVALDLHDREVEAR